MVLFLPSLQGLGEHLRLGKQTASILRDFFELVEVFRVHLCDFQTRI